MSTGCQVCDDKAGRLGVDAEFDKGGTGAFVSRAMTARGFPFSADVVNRHKRENHRRDYEKEAPPKSRAARDAAQMVKNKALDMLEADAVDITTREGQGVAKLALQAQSLEDKRERNKPKQQFFLQLFMEQQSESKLLADPDIIEGEARDVTDE